MDKTTTTTTCTTKKKTCYERSVFHVFHCIFHHWDLQIDVQDVCEMQHDVFWLNLSVKWLAAGRNAWLVILEKFMLHNWTFKMLWKSCKLMWEAPLCGWPPVAARSAGTDCRPWEEGGGVVDLITFYIAWMFRRSLLVYKYVWFGS